MGGSYWTTSWACVQHPVNSCAVSGPTPLLRRSVLQRLALVVGGEQLRIVISNEFGERPLEVRATHVRPAYDGRSHGWNSVQAAPAWSLAQNPLGEPPAIPITFDGQAAVLVPPGQTRLSDAARLNPGPVVPLATHQLELTMELGDTLPERLTGHLPVPSEGVVLEQVGPPHDPVYTLRATAKFAGPPRVLSAPSLFIHRVEVTPNSRHSVAALIGEPFPASGAVWPQGEPAGDWRGWLLHRMLATGASSPVLIDQSLEGNRLLRPDRAPSVSARFHRDAVALSGVTDVVVHAGLSDLLAADDSRADGYPWPNVSTLIGTFRRLASLARAHGKRIHVTTLTPPAFPQLTQGAEETRRTLNAWFKHSPVFDRCIDLQAGAPRIASRLDERL